MVQRVAVSDSVLQRAVVCCSVLLCVAACCSVLQCVAVYCIVLQCVAVRCSMLHCMHVCQGISREKRNSSSFFFQDLLFNFLSATLRNSRALFLSMK